MDKHMKQYKLPEVRVKLTEGTALYSAQPVNSPEGAVRVMADMLSELDREYVCVVNMDSKLHPINYNIVSIGGLSESLVPMTNIFKSAILSNAGSIVVLHNHPSGDLTPSNEDINVTKRIMEASKIMDIRLNDHIIVGGGSGDYYSMLEHGLLSQERLQGFVREGHRNTMTKRRHHRSR